MNTSDIIQWGITFICVVVGFWLGHQKGVLEGGEYMIHELMQKGSVTIIHTDSGCKMVWEVNVPDEKISKDK